jgi:hypothetical protein
MLPKYRILVGFLELWRFENSFPVCGASKVMPPPMGQNLHIQLQGTPRRRVADLNYFTLNVTIFVRSC